MGYKWLLWRGRVRLLTTERLSQGTCPKMAQAISPLCWIPAGKLELIHSQPRAQVRPARMYKGDSDRALDLVEGRRPLIAHQSRL